MKKSELLQTGHDVQYKWVGNQIAKNQADSFNNMPVAERAFNDLGKLLVPDNSDIEHFISVYLSAVGTRRLVTTMRVGIKRAAGANRLQVDIKTASKLKLEELMTLSGMTQIQVVDKLIREADPENFKVTV